jgi:hypothetical protein
MTVRMRLLQINASIVDWKVICLLIAQSHANALIDMSKVTEHPNVKNLKDLEDVATVENWVTKLTSVKRSLSASTAEVKDM